MKITITEGWSDCDDCGSYEWHDVVCEELGYVSHYDGHLSGGLLVEEMLIEILEKLGHTVEYVDKGKS